MAQSSQVGASVDMYVMIIGGTIMLFLLASGIIIFMVMYQRRMLEHKMSVQIAETKHQQELFYSTLEAIEDERIRVARDLHDEVGASLGLMRLLVGQMPTTKVPEIQETNTQYKQLIDSTIDNVRRISNDLLPQGLEEAGLAFAIESLCEKILSISDLDIALNIDTNVTNLGNIINLASYRILQELLNNAVKHSGATLIEIRMSKESSILKIDYADNGKGFDFEQAYKKKSLGLKNIETRTKVLKGTATFETQPNAGLKVRIEIPLIH
ncbi:sensor histidine kinase [Emticicia sp. BO119]|uniref:sensor histidine kinase n=1 Tax=Emticicia sp. BO119 TaxID=2757768 RepID=UPI0015F0120E|nr:sensor histidine kinase [Emticicia sp. BO119]MBA4849556.1 sensor histidine kinase [Emticicia sp. BO119]